MIINKFALFLVIGAAITGFFWLVYKLSFQKKHKAALINGEKPLSRYAFFEGMGGFFPVIAFVLIFRSFLFEPFQIPSGSMMKTLLVGDFLLVNKFNYGIKNPVTNETWIEFNQPQRGDIVVFKAPVEGNIDYIKRVIGMPGERVIYDFVSKEIQIVPNCQNIPNNLCKPVDVVYSAPEISDFFDVNNSDHILQLEPGEADPDNLDGTRLLQRTETINGQSHTILINPNKRDYVDYYVDGSRWHGKTTREFIIPEDSYFVMGDNRDNSQDARFFGAIHKDSLVGNAVFIWISFNRLPGEWPNGIRFSRIGTIH